ncbi:MAG: tungsten ABC transporter substrate-binding protein, partial [Candidatus Limnocylindria bacterium]|nr:tungsten ABC transporter substrate-binding protein [Candidatus Limnocylindria bacterium]
MRHALALVVALALGTALGVATACGGAGSPPNAPGSPVTAPGSSASAAPEPAAAATPLRSPARPELLLATTTSTQDSGLLDVLIPEFEKRTGYKVKTTAVGTGAALAIGARG